MAAYDHHPQIYVPTRYNIVTGGRLGVESWTELLLFIMTTTRSQSYKNRAERQLSPQHVIIATAKRKPRRRTTTTLKNKRVPTRSDRRRKRHAKSPRQHTIQLLDTNLFYTGQTERWKRQRKSPLKHRKRPRRRGHQYQRQSKISDNSSVIRYQTPTMNDPAQIDTLRKLCLPQPSEQYPLIELPAQIQ
ncbi:hypothetical protein CPB86DRAFT_473817 [Serendipita vermifera]|nr:hypothetical protein CPB86DRAFT_473817 [Serendipita vermifera]